MRHEATHHDIVVEHPGDVGGGVSRLAVDRVRHANAGRHHGVVVTQGAAHAVLLRGDTPAFGPVR
ncbi:hypothetical protein [Burkholderia stabilis]|uniref:hypothetical protein n=1 Tax=Burkholderia stabilis TaxID=95485 RepID=UPI001F4A6106|nr:hypothetical protein [Burkholderia stabilis]